MNKQNKEPNDIRVSANSRISSIIRYCNALLKDKSTKFLHFSAVGAAINNLVYAVENLKIVNAGLYQSTKISTVAYQSVDNEKKVENQRFYPKMEIVLSLEPKEKNEGFQEKYSEEQRQALFKILSNMPSRRQRMTRRVPMRAGFRGRRGVRRGAGRGIRRGTGRGIRRGASRGFRARGFRAGFRGMRNGTRGGPRFGRRGNGNRGK